MPILELTKEEVFEPVKGGVSKCSATVRMKTITHAVGPKSYIVSVRLSNGWVKEEFTWDNMSEALDHFEHCREIANVLCTAMSGVAPIGLKDKLASGSEPGVARLLAQSGDRLGQR